MKFLFLLGLSVFITATSFAQGSNPIYVDVRDEARRTLRLVERHGEDLSYDQKVRVLELLRTINRVIQQDPIGHNDRCINDSPEATSDALKLIRDAAYSHTGLNLSMAESDAFAREWIESNPCSRAREFNAEIKKLKDYAYAAAGLNMTSNEALAYTLRMIKRSCYADVNYKAEFKKYYDFAYSPSGLNLTSREATKYGQERMEERYFVCGRPRH
ncbi:MAG: hypothetical protein IT289_09925 [Oligoflexia bacterium]|nr:hypothetical protein [Oligoflexia bacterium]